MKIAILGWGSLIWSPTTLQYNKEIGWDKEGPKLPIEFSRISQDGRLTLVLDKNADNVQTFFTTSSYQKLDEAVLNLAERERCSTKKIGYYEKISGEFNPHDFLYKENIKEWMNSKDFDAAIWTNLGKKFKDEIGFSHNAENVIKYLENLPEKVKNTAEEYIRKTPGNIKTPIRQVIIDRLKWTEVQLKP